jgi:hypothetical protein
MASCDSIDNDAWTNQKRKMIMMSLLPSLRIPKSGCNLFHGPLIKLTPNLINTTSPWLFPPRFKYFLLNRI